MPASPEMRTSRAMSSDWLLPQCPVAVTPAGVSRYCRLIRWYSFAQPPATGCDASGIFAGNGSAGASPYHIRMISVVVSLILFVAAAWWLRRTLPFQNVAMIFAVLVAGEAMMEANYNYSHFQFAPLFYWPGVLVALRISVRWLLRQFGLKNCGIWLVVIVTILATFLQWLIAAKEIVGRAICTPLILALLAPWFVSKLPYQPHHEA